jgi:uncharacterized protein YifN (PemK superfamily)
MNWFRCYSEFATDPKVQIMPEHMQRRLVMILCLRSSNVLATLLATEIAFSLRITEQELAETKAVFIDKGFIDNDWNVLNWDKRQYVSDSSTERSRKYREKRKQDVQQPCNVAATLPDTDTDTDIVKDIDKSISKKPTQNLKPENVSQAVWDDFKKLRKDKKATITQTALNGIIREAEQANITLEAALQECCARGWGGFKAEWYNNSKGNSYATGNNHGKPNAHDNVTEGIELLLSRRAGQQEY